MNRLLSLLLGYLCGNFLTAEAVTKHYKGKSVFTIGSGNPGMANVMAQCGFVPGILTLAGDLAKTVLPCVLCLLLPVSSGMLASSASALLRIGSSGSAAGAAGAAGRSAAAPAHRILCAYAGLGACLGHNFPFWHKFRGGKGVSCTCAALFCLNPLWGLLAMAVGMFVVFATGYLPLGAVLIPAAFIPTSWFLFRSPEITVLVVCLSILMFIRNFPGFCRVIEGKEKKIPVADSLKKKLGRYAIWCIAAGAAAVLLIALFMTLR